MIEPVNAAATDYQSCPGETLESKAGGLQVIQAIAGLGPQAGGFYKSDNKSQGPP